MTESRVAATPSPSRRRGVALAAVTVLAAAFAASFGVSLASTAPRTTRSPVRRAARPVIDRYVAAARQRYDKETSGAAVHLDLVRLAADPVLMRALRAGDLRLVRSYVRSEFQRVWYHWHVSRLRIVEGSRVLTEVGVPFALSGQQRILRTAAGRPLATLYISVQDEVGIVKAMRRHFPVDVVIRGARVGHAVTLLPAAKHAALPVSGRVTLAGLRYQVRSFHRTAFGGEPVTVWVLMRG